VIQFGAIALISCARIGIRLYVAGRRVNLLLASSGCAPDCTRRPAPGSLPFRILRTEEFHGENVKANDCQSLGKFIHPADLAF